MGNYFCGQITYLNDAHGSYNAWATSFIKYDGYFNVADDGPGDDDFTYKSGYVPAFEAIQQNGGPFGGEFPAFLLGFEPGPGATFSIVPGKLDANGDLMPCDIEAPGSGECITSRIWEIDLGAKDFFLSFIESESNAWIAPYGGTMTTECQILPFYNSFFPRVTPASLTGDARNYNNVKPPNYHVEPPLPHESIEFSLTLRDGDGTGKGWWNTLKYHSNQYVLDNGDTILHRGTLVDKGETTEKFALKDGTYYLRMLGHLDANAFDDTWSLATKDGTVIASGGRYDRATVVVSGGAISSAAVDNVWDTPNSPDLKIAQFDGLMSVKDFEPSAHKFFESVSTSPAFKQYSHIFAYKDALETLAPKQSFTDSLASHPLDTAGILLATALFGMISMYGVLSWVRPATSKQVKYEPVMDVSQNIPTPRVEIQLEKTSKREVPVCQL